MSDRKIARQVACAVEALRSGGVVAFPTETFYGLAADALCAEAVERVARIKGRGEKAIACIVADEEQARTLCSSWPAAAALLARRFWPGPLTLVLPARAEIPAPLRPRGSVGLRRSSHPLATALVQALGRPITATSANLPGGPEATRAQDIDPVLRDRLAGVLDGGPTPGKAPSTVVDLTVAAPACLREGVVPFAQVLAALEG